MVTISNGLGKLRSVFGTPEKSSYQTTALKNKERKGGNAEREDRTVVTKTDNKRSNTVEVQKNEYSPCAADLFAKEKVRPVLTA